jgi:anti-anti-sigma factor
MKLNVRFEENHAIIDIEGRMTIDKDYRKLDLLGHHALQQGYKHIILDLKSTQMMDSSGLGELVRFRKEIMSKGGLIILVTGKESIPQILLETSGLSHKFTIVHKLSDALSKV